MQTYSDLRAATGGNSYLPARFSYFHLCQLMRFFLLSAPLLGLLAACQPAATAPTSTATGPDVLTTADFEQSIGWGDADGKSLTTDKAHSGRWSVRVQPDVPYGYTYARPLGELSTTPMLRLQLDAWALRVSAGSTAQLVVQVVASKTDETNVFYYALPLATAVPTFGEWTAVHVPINLPTTASGDNRLKVYLWNGTATSPTYLDDVTLRRVAE